MSQVTAGPWRVGDAGHTVFGPPNGKPSPETVAKVTHSVNARLIAAAPTMLAALKGCIHHDNALLDAYRIPASLRRQIEQAITLADAERS